MHLALPRQHRLARRSSIRLEELSGEAWVQTSGSSPCALHVVRSCLAAGFDPRVAFESDDYQTVQGLVAAGVGVALIPQLALSVVREDIVIRALAPAPPTREVIALAPARRPPGAGAPRRCSGSSKRPPGASRSSCRRLRTPEPAATGRPRARALTGSGP